MVTRTRLNVTIMPTFPAFLTNSCQVSAEDDACGQWRSYGARAAGRAVAGTEKIALCAHLFLNHYDK